MGVTFGSPLNPTGLFNRFNATHVVVTAEQPRLCGWLDRLYADGGLDRSGEQILTQRRVHR